VMDLVCGVFDIEWSTLSFTYPHPSHGMCNELSSG